MEKMIGITALILVSSVVNAEIIESAEDMSGFYLGAGIGDTTFDSHDFDTSGVDDSDKTSKIIAGMQFGRIFALEGQYTQYGDLKDDFGSWSPVSISVSANLGYSFSNGLRPFGVISVIGLSAVDLGQSHELGEDAMDE